MRHQDLLQDIDSLPLCLQRVLSASHLCRSGWLLNVLALLSSTVKAIQHFVQIRKRHPFLPLGGGGPALPLASRAVVRLFFTCILGQAPLFSEQHIKPCVRILALPFWGSSFPEGVEAVDILDLSDTALILGWHEPWLTWSSTHHVFIELLLSKPRPHGQLPGPGHQACFPLGHNLHELWVL